MSHKVELEGGKAIINVSEQYLDDMIAQAQAKITRLQQELDKRKAELAELSSVKSGL